MTGDATAIQQPRTSVRGLAMPARPSRETLALGAVLLLSLGLGLFQLEREGFSNPYYAATVRSMLTSWHTFFFASYDPGGFVSVDKPPVGYWIQAASAALLGFNGFSLILPQVLATVGSVAIVHRIVRRPFGSVAALVAALALALTPIVVATARNNTTDMTLVFVLVLAAWAVSRAADAGRLRWLVLGFVLVGVAFNVKMLQAYLALPGLGLVYLVGAPVSRVRRLVHLAVAGIALAAVSLSWALAVDLTPASERPYVGGSRTNSVIELALGYNGLTRLLGGGPFGGPIGQAQPGPGDGTGTQVGPGSFASGPTDGENGEPGPLRLVNAQLGGQASWLLPLVVIGGGLVAARSRWRPRPDARARALLLWGGWLLAGAAFFSAAGFMHRYYLVTIAPPLAALAGAGTVTLWRSFRAGRRRWLLPIALAATAALQAILLLSYPEWAARLIPVVMAGTLSAVAILFLAAMRRGVRDRLGRPALVGALAVLLVAPSAWAALPVWNARGEMLPSAGPAGDGLPGGAVTVGPGGGGPGGGGPAIGRGPGPGAGRMLRATAFGGDPSGRPDSKLIEYLKANRGSARFLVATESAGTASPIIIATGEPVISLHGFGADRILTTEALAAMVRAGEVRFFLLSPTGPIGGGAASPGERDASEGGWVRDHCELVPRSAWSSGEANAGEPGDELYDCARTVG